MRGPMEDTILPIHIRPDVVVLIQGVPHDLKPQEADKIAAIVMAMATKEQL